MTEQIIVPQVDSVSNIHVASVDPLYRGLIGLWHYSNTLDIIYDLSGYGNHTAGIDGGITVERSRYGYTYRFPGGGGPRVRVLDDPILSNLTSFSLGIFCKFEAFTGSGNSPLISKGERTGNKEYRFRIIGETSLNCHFSTNGSDELGGSVGLNVQLNTWYLFTATWDGSHIRMYSGDTFLIELTASGVMHYAGSDLAMGSYSDRSPDNLTGYIRSAFVYDRALSLPEIRTWNGRLFGGPHGAYDTSLLFNDVSVGPEPVFVTVDFDRSGAIVSDPSALAKAEPLLNRDMGVVLDPLANVSPSLLLDRQMDDLRGPGTFIKPVVDLGKTDGIDLLSVLLVYRDVLLSKQNGVDIVPEPLFNAYVKLDRENILNITADAFMDALALLGIQRGAIFDETEAIIASLSFAKSLDAPMNAQALMNPQALLGILKTYQLQDILHAVAYLTLIERESDSFSSSLGILVEFLTFSRDANILTDGLVDADASLTLPRVDLIELKGALSTLAALTLAIELDYVTDWTGGIFSALSFNKTVQMLNVADVTAHSSVDYERVEGILLSLLALADTDLGLDTVFQLDLSTAQANVVSVIFNRRSGLDLIDRVNFKGIFTLPVSKALSFDNDVISNPSIELVTNRGLANALSALIDESVNLDRQNLIVLQATTDVFLVGIVDAQLVLQKLYQVNARLGTVGEVNLTLQQRTKH